MITAVVSARVYWPIVVVVAVAVTALCDAARRHPGRWPLFAARALGLLLAADGVTYYVGLAIGGHWSLTTSLPLALCDAALLVAAAACWWETAMLVELTYFWGLAGTLQAVATPDLSSSFPHLAFFEYLVGHLGIVAAALFLVAGMGHAPRPGAVRRVFVVTAVYTALVGLFDWATGADYMFLRQPPSEWTVLRLLGPWPWYIFSAAGVAVVLLVVLDLPFSIPRRLHARHGTSRPTSAPVPHSQ